MNCPHCQRLLYSRRHQTCGFCGGELPAECLLSEYEVAEIKEEQQEIAARRARDKEKEEEVRRQSSGSGGNDTIWMS
jgi:hypothetical protein